jgi:aspartate carbamoyltransferase regulatory subunit
MLVAVKGLDHIYESEVLKIKRGLNLLRKRFWKSTAVVIIGDQSQSKNILKYLREIIH